MANEIKSTLLGVIEPDGVVENVNSYFDEIDDGVLEEEDTSLADVFPKEDELEEETETVDKETEEVEDGDEEDDEDSEVENEYGDHSEAAMVLLSFKESGDLPEELEVPKEANWTDFVETWKDHTHRQLEQIKESYIARLDSYASHVKFLADGGDPKVLSEAMSFSAYTQLDIEGEENKENQKRVLRVVLEPKVGKEEAESLIEIYEDKQQLGAKAKAAQNTLKKREQDIIEQSKAQQEKAKATQMAQAEAWEADVHKIIDKGKVLGLDLSVKDKKDLKKALFEKTELVTFRDQSGVLRKTKVTKMQKLQNELSQDKEKQIAFAKFLLNGFSVGKIVKKEMDKANIKMLDHLNGKTTRRRKVKKKRNAFDDFGK